MSNFGEFEDFDQLDEDAQFGGMSAEEVDRREAAFLKQVEQRITMLKKRKQYSAKERIEAARWLGESGALDAIVPLVTVYARDKTPGMKEAAAYALGQFKALEETLEDDALEPMVEDTIRNIILYEEFGQPAPTRRILLTQLGLVISAVVLVVVGALLLQLPSNSESQATALAAEATDFATRGITATFTPSVTPSPTGTPDRVDIQAGLAVEYVDSMDGDAEILREQFNVIGRDGSGQQDCNIIFNRPAPFEPSAAGAADDIFSDLVDTLNGAREEIEELVVLYIRNCNNPAGLTQQQAAGSGSAAIDAQRTLVPARETLVFLNAQGPGGAPTAEATAPAEAADATATPQAEPSATPTESIDPDTLRSEIQTVQGLITELTTFRGPAPTLTQYWNDVSTSGTSAGCNQAPIIVPETNYELALNLQQANEPLAQSVSNLNVALDLLRDGYANFYEGCRSSNLEALVTDQLVGAEAAETALSNAQAAIQEAQAQLR